MFGIFSLFRKKKEYRKIVSYDISVEDLEEFIYRWNINNPMDRWYREKHGICFNSPEHRIVSLIDICYEFIEDNLYNGIISKQDDVYIQDRGDFIKEKKFDDEINKYSDQQLIDAFNNLDIKEE
jgi:hypothetical protein